MQIRELNLKELYTVYDLVSQLYKDLSYEEFEDLIYDMRDMNYIMLGIIDEEELITYAGISVQTTLKEKRHLKVFDFITDKKHNTVKFDTIMKEYLQDYAKVAMCQTIIY